MTISAADVVIPSKPTSLYEDLKALVEAAGPNKHDQAIVLIMACIDARIDTISLIMAPAIRLGLSRGHIANTLKHGLGNRWRCDAQGIYTNLE